ncbi:MAG: LptF/LptG family permease [Bacteroidales bacterium]|nr:LptF/LptG family permease [Bacteroidales bacterium]
MKKIDIYIIKKFLGTFFFAIALLVVIVIVFDISEKIDDFIEKEAPLKEILFSYYLNFIPYFVNLFSYLFTFIAVIFFTSKMASDSEIVAILSGGVSFWRFLVPYLISAIFLGLMSFYLANFLIPRTNKKMMAFEKVYHKNPFRYREKDIHMQIKPGIFVYMENFNNLTNTGYKFSMETFNNNRLISKLSADRIIWDSTSVKWEVRNYFIRKLDGANEVITKGTKMDTTINIHPSEFTLVFDDIKTMNFPELLAFIEKEKLKGSSKSKEYEVEKHKRIAFPFATLVLTLIGVSISSRKMRGGIGMHLGFGMAITFAYIMFLQVSTVFATRGDLVPWLSVWLPNFIFILLGIYLVIKAPK